MDMASKEQRGPTVQELAAIDDEWPQIEADLTALEAEIRMLARAVHRTSHGWLLGRACRRVLPMLAFPSAIHTSQSLYTGVA